MSNTDISKDRTDDRMRELLNSALDVMDDFGIQRTRMGDVASRAGVARQTVYEYFPSREDLLSAALKEGAARIINAGFSAAERHGGTPLERLTTLMEVSLSALRRSPQWSSPAKRAELAPFITLEDNTFLGAGVTAMLEALRTWWPNLDERLLDTAADNLCRAIVSHGLAPTPVTPREIAESLTQLLSSDAFAR